MISGYFLPLAKEKWNGKLAKHIQENPPTIDSITKNVRKLTGPNFLKTFFFSFTSNSLTTAVRRKHFQTPENACLYCKTGEDSIGHLFNSCSVVKAAATGLFSSLGLPPSTTPTTLRKAFLADPIPTQQKETAAATLCFTFAVWSFRLKTTPIEEKGDEWVVSHLQTLARANLSSFTDKKKRDAEDVSRQISTIPPDAIVCYTDGSASPNPGPCGAGVHVKIPSQTSHTAWDMGADRGAGTNNLGELWALGVALWCILEAAKPMHSAAYIFTDSNYAIGVATGKWKGKHPLIDKLVVDTLARTRSVIPVNIVWTPGHSGVAGNERADRIADIFSHRSKISPPSPSPLRTSPLSFLNGLVSTHANGKSPSFHLIPATDGERTTDTAKLDHIRPRAPGDGEWE